MLAIALAVAAIGCSAGGEPDAVVVDASPAGPGDGTEVLADVGPSVALVQTPLGSGPAVLLDDGHLVTNAHVVDPFPEVSVAFEGEDATTVPVVGVDLAADVAVLGPVEVSRPGLALAASDAVPSGADLYLVGFPGDAADPEVTIARGVLSRRRDAPDWTSPSSSPTRPSARARAAGPWSTVAVRSSASPGTPTTTSSPWPSTVRTRPRW